MGDSRPTNMAGYLTYTKTEPPPGAETAFIVHIANRMMGTIVMRRTTGRYGGAAREWLAYRPGEPNPEPVPLHSKRDAATRLMIIARREREDSLPAKREPADPTRDRVEAARQAMGTAPALWLAASLTIAHVERLQTDRANTRPAAAWAELARIRDWMLAAMPSTADEDQPPATAAITSPPVDYRRTGD